MHAQGRKAALIGMALLLFAGAARAQDQTRTPDQTRAQDQIYDSHLMTPQERANYRARMQSAKTAQEREQIRAEHHEPMQARAKERGVTLLDQPPARGGGGMGPGGGGRRH